jgi:8-amino-7-oxononanoate synthase
LNDGHVLDFTSALYLGLDHPSGVLAGWERLTLGKPAVLEAPPGSREVEQGLAALIGCERALLGPSTLHLFWDLFGALAGWGASIFLDAGSYPIARWGVDRAAARGTPVRTFRSHDAHALRRLLHAPSIGRPVIVADGYSPASGTPAPVAEYLECLGPLDGLVVLDDTQALGIYGHSQEQWPPYGKEGGGSLKRAGVRDDRVVIVSSLAKAFGAPLAVLAGSEAFTTVFEQESATRTHCSPPSAAVIAAATHALRVNRQSGDALRLQLAQRVGHLRRGLRRLNLIETESLFPVQPLRMPERVDPNDVHRRLLEHGVLSVLQSGQNGAGARLSFVVATRHTLAEIDRAVACLANAIAGARSRNWKGGKGDDSTIAGAAGTVRSVFGNIR